MTLDFGFARSIEFASIGSAHSFYIAVRSASELCV